MNNLGATDQASDFHAGLDSLRQRLSHMSRRAESLVSRAVDALLTRDGAKAKAVISGRGEVHIVENEVEQLVLRLLELHQSSEADLRLIVGAIKMSSDLERVGDHAVSIAESARRLLSTRLAITPVAEIDEIARRARTTFSTAIESFDTSARAFEPEDSSTHSGTQALQDSLFRVLVRRMTEHPHTISAAREIFLVSRNLERVTDLASDIGRDAAQFATSRQSRQDHDEHLS